MSRDSQSYYAETLTIFVEPIRDPSPFARTFNINHTNRPPSKSGLSAFAYGLGAGLVGITAMGITQTIEQHLTGRPAVRVPGESITRFLARNFGCQKYFRSGSGTSSKTKGKGKEKEQASKDGDEGDEEPSNLTEPPSEGGELSEPNGNARVTAKWITYFGQGAVLGGVRGILSYYGARGALSDMMFLAFTSSVDRSPFWSEMAGNVPLPQLLFDSVPELVHQTVYAFVTGFFCDHWVN